MAVTAAIPPELYWQKDAFRFIKANEFERLGIDPTDIPAGTFAALKHPSHLPSRFGGNAYGFGLFEFYDRLKPKDIQLLQSVDFDNPKDIAKHYKAINAIYSRIGLLIRFSKFGKPYYLIPVHLASDTLTHIKSKVDEIAKIIGFHSKKFLKEYHDIGLVADTDDLISRELSLRFKDHNFVTIDSMEKLQGLKHTLDLVILTRDLYEIILVEKFGMLPQEMLNKKQMEHYGAYVLWKLYNVLKPDGEIFIISNAYTPKTNKTAEIAFKGREEEKNFSLFTHIFQTKKKYRPKGQPLQINIFDFQKYLSGLYVEQKVINNLLQGRNLENMSFEQINDLPYLNYPLGDFSSLCEQEKTWPRLLSIYFNQIFFKPLVPPSVNEDWNKRFSPTEYSPKYMMIYLGQKKALKTTRFELMQEADGSGMLGCPVNLLPGYRDSFAYVIHTLEVLRNLKNGTYGGLPEILIDRLRQPLTNKNRRFSSLNDIIKLIGKIKKLKKIKQYLNPGNMEGTKTRIIQNLEALSFFGFTRNELKEIIYIVYGHTSLGRIVSGKSSIRTFVRVLALAHSFETQEAINFLRYCRLMTMAEMEAAMGTSLIQEQVAELFDFHDAAARVVTNPQLEWNEVIDDRIGAMGGIHNKVVRKILKTMNYYEFINNWAELESKGRVEKEVLADYDATKAERIENVIRLATTMDQFEKNFKKWDQHELPAFYRSILNKEYHGTGYLFERMNSRIVFVLVAIAANISGVEIINLNPLLAGVEAELADERVKRIEREAQDIHIRYLDPKVLANLSEQLYRHHYTFILGTGFRMNIRPETRTLAFFWVDVDEKINSLETLSEKISGISISDMEIEDLIGLETIFSELESLYKSHVRCIAEIRHPYKLPLKQEKWVQKITWLRDVLRSGFLSVFFRPEHIYTNLDRLYRYCPRFLDFIFPEFTALHEGVVSWHLYMTSPVTQYILAAVRKLQALITHDRINFQDTNYLHRLAQREFGPMATGTVGVSDLQIQELENIVAHLSKDKPLFEALIKAIIFQDLGRLPALREKYKHEINPAELAQASALFIEKEGTAKTYDLDDQQKSFLIFLVRQHSLFHHILRGEFAFPAIKKAIPTKDRGLFDAFFVFSFIMLASIRDDLILEDLADQLFKTRAVMVEALEGKTTIDENLDKIYLKRGNLFYAFEYYRNHGLPGGMDPASFLDSHLWQEGKFGGYVEVGKAVSALERIFRLRGIRHIKYIDMVNLMIKVPLKYIYKERKLSSVGYASFEKELFEALRIYNSTRALSEKTRRFILDQLVGDRIRIFGYEKVSNYLNYKNQIKLLFLGVLAATKFDTEMGPVCLNFLTLCEKIEKRYEAINDYLNKVSLEPLLENPNELEHLFTDDTGLIFKREQFPNVCTIDFLDQINMAQKLSYMQATKDLEQLKSYYQSSMTSLKSHPFPTEDYQEAISKAFAKRKTEIIDSMLQQARKKMGLINDFKELHNFVENFLVRSEEVGFSEEQKYRLNDLYEMRKQSLKAEKRAEIDSVLDVISDIREIKDYWESIRWYLKSNRRFFGKEFEIQIAHRFDKAEHRIKSEIW